MSEYNNSNLYFLKLYDWFINSDEIRWIESQEHGAEIVIMFFRLMMIAKNKNGKIARIVGKMENPYTIKEMTEATYQTEERVKEGLELLIKAELVVKEGECYSIPKALEFTNQTTVGAVKKQKQRREKADKEVDNCPTDIEEDKEIEKRNKNKEEETYIEKDDWQCKEIIEHLNNVTGCEYRTDSKNTINLIKQHMKEGYKKEDFINVIDKKYKEWKDTEREKYVRPETLFGDKFEAYVNQKEKRSMFDDVDLNSLYANFN